MKKTILNIVLCVILCFTLSACGGHGQKNETEASNTPIININDPYAFDSIANLLTAIKKNLQQYENIQVSVKGYILEINEQLTLTDVSGKGGAMNRYYAKKSANIKLFMLDHKTITVLDTGDYVRISGTVKISDTEIYLDSCDYEMIESIYE